MKDLLCDCRNAVRLTAVAGVYAMFSGDGTASRATAPNVMRKVLGTENVDNTSHGTTGKTKSVVALRTRVSALTDTIVKPLGGAEKRIGFGIVCLVWGALSVRGSCQ